MCHDIRYSHWDEASSIVQKGDLSGREFSDINDDSLVAVQDYTFTCAQLRCFSSRAVMWTLSSILIRDATRRVRECQVHASHAPHLSLVVVDFLITNSDNQQWGNWITLVASTVILLMPVNPSANNYEWNYMCFTVLIDAFFWARRWNFILWDHISLDLLTTWLTSFTILDISQNKVNNASISPRQ